MDSGASPIDRDAIEALVTGLAGTAPLYRWQRRLLQQWLLVGRTPPALEIPTGLGKTKVMALWLIARAAGADLPRRLVYVVDRRAVVDQATAEAEALRDALGRMLADTRLNVGWRTAWRENLGLDAEQALPISTLRGQFVDNRRWLEHPASAAIVVGTVDMVGSRLLFQGYGVSPRMRPVHAGLLGADALVLLDEAHLVPPFEALLDTVAGRRGRPVCPPETPVPGLRLMALSATGRTDDKAAFTLVDEDWDDDPPVRARLDAAKRLALHPVSAAGLADDLVERAWALGGADQRVAVFCNSRRTAQEVHDKLETRARKAFGKDVAVMALLVGTRRVRERAALRSSAAFQRFQPGSPAPATTPVFLVGTSAGEVGVDLDADHLVCDLVPWDRMVQRLGRVNRRPDPGQALVEVLVAPSDKEKEAEDPAAAERLAALRAPFVLPSWPTDAEGRRDASPGRLVRLKANPALAAIFQQASTGTPLHPALDRATVDAWSMTSLPVHPGRPDVAPWLRGWIDREPQSTLVWRRLFPLRIKGSRATATDGIRGELKRFFQSAPPHLSETLEAPASLATDMLKRRAAELLKRTAAPDDPAHPPVVVLLGPQGDVEEVWDAETLRSMRTDALERALGRGTAVLDARFAGLDPNGLLSAKAATVPVTLDGPPEFGPWLAKAEIGFRICMTEVSQSDEDWPVAYRWPLAEDADDGWELRVEVKRTGDTVSEGDGALARRRQLLDEHHDFTGIAAGDLADRLGLAAPYRAMLVAAARSHDAGKARREWQAAMRAPRDGIYAKTIGGGNPAALDGYRHEFGSLRDAAHDPAIQALPPELRELALHLIAAHHGYARPVIRPLDPDVPPSASAVLARDAALRFEALQRRWGPWGLAWWEALLRAADWAASGRLDRKG